MKKPISNPPVSPESRTQIKQRVIMAGGTMDEAFEEIKRVESALPAKEETPRYEHLPRLGPLDEDTEYDIDRYAVAYASRLELRNRADSDETRRFADRAANEEYATLETLRARIRELVSRASQPSSSSEITEAPITTEKVLGATYEDFDAWYREDLIDELIRLAAARFRLESLYLEQLQEIERLREEESIP